MLFSTHKMKHLEATEVNSYEDGGGKNHDNTIKNS